MSAATLLWAADGPDEFTVRKLARKLKVGPTTIYAHFKGGLPELRREVARKALVDRTPPYEPKQEPKDYLRDILKNSLAAFRDVPHLGRLVVSELTNDPLLSLTFAERMGSTFQGLKKSADVVWALEVFIAKWAGLLLLEIGGWARQDAEVVKARLQARLIDVSAVEFPTLKAAPQHLGALLGKRAQPTYLEKVADVAAAAFLSDLAKGHD